MDDTALRRCGKFHNVPSEVDPQFCRRCMGEEVPTGKPSGEEPSEVEDGEEEETNEPVL
jgi:hypothetical protein